MAKRICQDGSRDRPYDIGILHSELSPPFSEGLFDDTRHPRGNGHKAAGVVVNEPLDDCICSSAVGRKRADKAETYRGQLGRSSKAAAVLMECCAESQGAAGYGMYDVWFVYNNSINVLWHKCIAKGM